MKIKMNTLTNAYITKISSGLLLVLLITSSLAILPIALTAHAASAPTASFSYPYVTVGTAGAVRRISITNPLTNPGIIEVDVNIPAAAATTVTAGAFVSGFVATGAVLVAGSGPWTNVYPGTSSTTTILPAGAKGRLSFTFSAEASEATAGIVDPYTITVISRFTDGTSTSQTLTLYEGRATTSSTALTSVGTTFTVGSGVGLTSTLALTDSGLALTFTSTPATSDVVTDGFSASFTPSSGTTVTGGTTSATYVSTEASTQVAADGVLDGNGGGLYTVMADAGTAAVGVDTGGLLTATASATFTYTASGPSTIKVKVGTLDASGKSPTYISTPTAISIGPTSAPGGLPGVTLADVYGNSVGGASLAGSLKLSATAGTMSNYGELAFVAGVLNRTVTYTGKPPGSALPLAFGTSDLIGATLTVTAPASIVGTFTGASKPLSIGYIDTTSIAATTPAVTMYTKSPSDATKAAAGSTVGLKLALTAQVGVPVNFTLTTTVSTTPYTGTFSNGKSWIVVNSNSLGVAAANFTADKVTGDAATANAIVSEPLTSTPATTVPSLSTAAITTAAAKAASLKVSTFSDTTLATSTKYASPSGTLWLKVSLADVYGNTATNSFTAQIQITLTASAGGLSSTTVYIAVGASNTAPAPPAGDVQFTAPATLGPITLGATTTQPGITAATKTISVVGSSPQVFFPSTNTASTTAATATVTGYAIVSPGAALGTFVASFKYSLSGGANGTTPVTSINSTGAAFFSITITLAAGANALKVYAIDSAGKQGAGTFTVTQTAAVPFGQTFAPTATSTTVSGVTFAQVSAVNQGTTSLAVYIYIQIQNSAGQVVLLTFSSQTVAAGATSTAFSLGLSTLPHGTYTIQTFVVTTSGAAVSNIGTATVTV